MHNSFRQSTAARTARKSCDSVFVHNGNRTWRSLEVCDVGEKREPLPAQNINILTKENGKRLLVAKT